MPLESTAATPVSAATRTSAPPTATPRTKSSASAKAPSLTCTQTFSLPIRQLGGGTDESTGLTYVSAQPAWQCTFSRDGYTLAACFGAPDPCIRIWTHPQRKTKGESSSSSTWKLTATLSGIHERTVRSVAFAPLPFPSLILASASFDGTLAIWEYSQREETVQTTLPASGDHDETCYWDCIAQLEGHDNEAKCVVWNATGSLLASCGRDKSVWIWECLLPGTVGGNGAYSDIGDNNRDDFDCLAVLHGHEGDVKTCQFAPSHDQWGEGDEILLSASYDATIKVWAEEAGDWYCAATLSGVHTATIWSIALSPSGARLISASADQSLAIYKAYTHAETVERKLVDPASTSRNGLWKCVGTLPKAHAGTIYSVDSAPSRVGHGRLVSGGADHAIQVYREALTSTSDQPLFSLETAVTLPSEVNCVVWHPNDGSLLASASDDGTVRLWKYKVGP